VKIGVFDSGKGGLSVYLALKRAFPDQNFIFKNDVKNLPYGNKTKSQLLQLTKPIFDQFEQENCQIVVIACNSVSTQIFEELKSLYSYLLIPVVPMIEEASQLTISKKIIVCATSATLTSLKYLRLKEQFGDNLEFYEPDCSQWALMIEDNMIDKNQIRQAIEPNIQKGSDVVVLACTHYHWIEQDIINICHNRAQVIQPEYKIIEALRQLL